MEDYVAKAEKAIKKLSERTDRWGNPQMVTTSQIRKFLTAVNTVSGKVDMVRNQGNRTLTVLPVNIQAEIKFLKVKIAYQIGRDKQNLVRDFEKQAGLFSEIDKIGDSVERYEEFAHYVEALVAFHKYYGGKEK